MSRNAMSLKARIGNFAKKKDMSVQSERRPINMAGVPFLFA